MLKFLSALLALMLTAFTYGQESLKSLIRENERSIFLVQCFNDKNQVTSTGSGFFIEKDGVAYTNVHVIKDAYRATVKTTDGKFYEIEKVVDYNPTLDIAKVKIKNTSGIVFPVVKIASKRSEKGDAVFAIGNPDGLESSVSTGIVSSIRTITNYGQCYQITAPISPGSSGGALFNMNGEVIGIVTFGQIDAGRLNQNLNFAVNIDNAKYLTNSLDLTIEKAYTEMVYENFVAAYMRAELSNDFDRAIQLCTQQISKKPSDWLAYHCRAISYLKTANYSDAESDFLKAIQLNPTDRLKDFDYVGLGKIYRRARLYEKSKEAYLKALAINKKNATCYCNLATLTFEWLGPENELVEQSYSIALQLDPESCPFGYKKIGEKFSANKEYKKAVLFFTKSIELENDALISINEYFNRGACFYYLEDYANAVLDFQYCLKLMPSDHQSYLFLGLCYVAQGKKIDACATFNKALEIVEGISKDKEARQDILNTIDKYCK